MDAVNFVAKTRILPYVSTLTSGIDPRPWHIHQHRDSLFYTHSPLWASVTHTRGRNIVHNLSGALFFSTKI